jgi:hypothetical protein
MLERMPRDSRSLLTSRRFLRVLSLGRTIEGKSNYDKRQQAKTLQRSGTNPEHNPSSVQSHCQRDVGKYPFLGVRVRNMRLKCFLAIE